MDNQDNVFDTNLFGIQETSIISDEDIFGEATTADPKDIKPLEEKKEETPEEEKLSIDDILDSDKGEEEKKEEIVKPKKEEFNKFQEYTNELVNLGIFSENESKTPITTPEEFAERWELESQTKANNIVNNFLVSKGQDAFDVFKALIIDGINPKDYIETTSRIESLKDLDISNESNQEKILRAAYQKQGMKSEAIDKKVQKSKDYGDLEEDATSFYDILLQQEESELEEMQQEAAKQQAVNKKRTEEYLSNMDNIITNKLKVKEFDGIPVTDKIARETFDYLTTERWQLPSGEKLTDFDKDLLELKHPNNHELRVKLALLLKNKLDLSKVKVTAITKESNKLFNNLAVKDKEIKKNDKTNSRSFFELL